MGSFGAITEEKKKKKKKVIQCKAMETNREKTIRPI